MERRAFLLAGAAAGLGLAAHAQERYPTRPIQVVVPFAAGGSTDLVIRPLAAEMEQPLGGRMVVLNRAGAGGAIGAQSVARAAPDGYTLLVGSAGPMVINPLLRSNVGYNPTEDFVPIAVVGTQPLALAVNPKVPARNLGELVAWLKSRGAPSFFGSSGNGSLPHLTGELLKAVTGTDLSHVAYQGGGPAVQGTIAGDVQILFDAIVSLLPHQSAGTLRILAVCDQQRSPLLKDVPTVAEAGFRDLESTTSNYFVAPKGTPAEIVAQLSAAAAGVMRSPGFLAKMEQVGVRFDPTLVGARVEAVLRDEIAKWAGVIRRAGIRIE